MGARLMEEKIVLTFEDVQALETRTRNAVWDEVIQTALFAKGGLKKDIKQQGTCKWIWTRDGDNGAGFWEPECKLEEDWSVGELQYGATFCCFCGKKIEEVL